MAGVAAAAAHTDAPGDMAQRLTRPAADEVMRRQYAATVVAAGTARRWLNIIVN